MEVLESARTCRHARHFLQEKLKPCPCVFTDAEEKLLRERNQWEAGKGRTEADQERQDELMMKVQREGEKE